jgi:tRNA (guanosine-2'-O-)-methyltransferase
MADYPPRMLTDDEQELQAYLESFLTQRRRERMREVLSQRTRYLACVLEDLYDPRNGSAVIRHCDALGIHEVHAIENKNRFKSDEQVDMGTAQWLDLRIYRGDDGIPRSVKARRRALASAAEGEAPAEPPSRTPEVLASLKERGFRIVATSPHADDDAYPETLDLTAGPAAVVFGTEKHGISDEVRAVADAFLRIPMVGFVESFNLSASAAIVFHVLSGRLRREGLPWHLDEDDAEGIYFDWVRRSAPHAEDLIKRFKEERG